MGRYKPDKTSGSSITRRDFLNGTALGVGGALLSPALAGQGFAIPRPSLAADWYGYGGVGDYRHSHGNTPDVVAAAHRLRDGELDADLTGFASAQEYDLVIVGAGMAGLSAALEFTKTRRPGQTCLLLDNHPLFGGEAKENEFNVNGTRLIAPQGANGFFMPPATSNLAHAVGDSRYYAELDIPREFALREWPASEKPLRFSPDNYEYLVRGLQAQSSVGHYFPGSDNSQGQWNIDMWQQGLANAPVPAATRAALLHWYGLGATRRFNSEQQAIRTLDSMSYQTFLTRELGLPVATARAGDLFLASACGLGSDAVSAYAAYQSPMPGLADVPPPNLRRTSFPGGNSGFARYFLKRLIPQAINGRIASRT